MKKYLLILILIISSFFFVTNVFAADCGGETDCNCGDYVVEDYTLTADIICEGEKATDGLIIDDDNITLDGNGHRLVGIGGSKNTGVSINGYLGVTVTGFSEISGFGTGIDYYDVYGEGESLGSITNNTIDDNASAGINIEEAEKITVSGNTITSSDIGLDIEYSTNVTANNNNFYDNTSYGVYIADGSETVEISDSTIDSSDIGIIIIEDSIDITIDNNTITNTTVDTGEITEDESGIYIKVATDITISDNTISGNDYGILMSTVGIGELDETSDITISGNTVNDNNYGIAARGSAELIKVDNVTVDDNTTNSNNYYGIDFASSENCDITNNTAFYNLKAGILIGENITTANNTLTGNTANNNVRAGILLDTTKGNTLSSNTMSGNHFNLRVSAPSSSNANDVYFDHTINTNNLVEGKPVYYLYNQDGTAESHLIYDGNSIGEVGMFWAIDSDYLEIKNVELAANNYHGILFRDVDNSLIQNVEASSSGRYGINLVSSNSNVLDDNFISLNEDIGIYADDNCSDNVLSSNTIYLNGEYGLYFLGDTAGNTVSDNIFSNNKEDFSADGSTNTFSSNDFSSNITTQMLSFGSLSTTTGFIGDTISFSNVEIFDIAGVACPDCTYSITTFPSETVNITKVDNILSGDFTVSENGIYSLIISVTDSASNVSEIQKRIIIGETDEEVVRYYYRNTLPEHAQLTGDNTYTNNAGELILVAPLTTEEWSNHDWLQNSVDEVLGVPNVMIKDIDIYTWYKTIDEGDIGVQRYSTYNKVVDQEITPIPASLEYSWLNEKFEDVNWMMDSQLNWYWLSLKLDGNYPYQQTTVAQPSYVDITYLHSVIPKISNIGNENISVLSSTAPADDLDDTDIILENYYFTTTSTDLTLANFNNPFLSGTTTITFTGTTTISSGDIISGTTTTLNSVDMDLTPSADSIDVDINTWNTSGTYSKEWIETSDTHDVSSEHTLGDLEPNKYYTVWYTKSGEDQASLITLQADANGEIDFTYSLGYSTVTFNVDEDTTSPAAFTLSAPSDNSHTSSVNPSLTWNASTDSESGISKYQLFIDSSLDTDNISSSATSVNTTSDLSCGEHTWYIRAYDNNGNYTDSNTYTIIKDCGGGGSPAAPASGNGSSDTSVSMNGSSDAGNIGSAGYNLLMYINSTANFNIQTSGSGSQSHSLNITDLDLLNNIVTITIHSDPITLELNLEETEYVDLDGDGINDLEVKFEDVVNNRVEITVKSINDNKNIWTSGQWVKTEDNPAVYLVDQNDVRHAYPNQKVWNSYFDNDFSFVETISSTELTSYTLGRNIPYNTGSLFKIPSVPKVYVVTEDNKVKWIKTEAKAIDLYGAEWNNLVHDLPEVFWNDYILEGEIE